MKLTELPNIGKIVAEKPQRAGITSQTELLEIGSEKAFIRIAAIDEKVCLSMLNALEGAILGIRWHNLEKSRKEELYHFYISFEKSKSKKS